MLVPSGPSVQQLLSPPRASVAMVSTSLLHVRTRSFPTSHPRRRFTDPSSIHPASHWHPGPTGPTRLCCDRAPPRADRHPPYGRTGRPGRRGDDIPGARGRCGEVRWGRVRLRSPCSFRYYKILGAACRILDESECSRGGGEGSRQRRPAVMPLFQEMESSSYVPYLRTHLQQIAASVSTASCGFASGGGGEEEECRDEAAALGLKMVAVAAILVAGAAGVAIPLVGRWRNRSGGGAASASGSGSGGLFVLAKAFAAGVILATGFVHMLHDAEEALTDPCLPAAPWRRFPFPGFVAMLAALGTLVVDFVGTHLYERKHRGEEEGAASAAANAGGREETAALLEDGALVAWRGDGEVRDGAGQKDAIHIVGMRTHAAAHRHSHAHGHGACDGAGAVNNVHGHGHGHGHDEEPSRGRHVAVAQILELGIVSHSVIIGLSLGVSESPCTIKPLVAALSFHQFFEGFALGGCISEAQFKKFSALMMAFFFAITTPAGITVGASRRSTTPTARGRWWWRAFWIRCRLVY